MGHDFLRAKLSPQELDLTAVIVILVHLQTSVEASLMMLCKPLRKRNVSFFCIYKMPCAGEQTMLGQRSAGVFAHLRLAPLFEEADVRSSPVDGCSVPRLGTLPAYTHHHQHLGAGRTGDFHGRLAGSTPLCFPFQLKRTPVWGLLQLPVPEPGMPSLARPMHGEATAGRLGCLAGRTEARGSRAVLGCLLLATWSCWGTFACLKRWEGCISTRKTHPWKRHQGTPRKRKRASESMVKHFL